VFAVPGFVFNVGISMRTIPYAAIALTFCVSSVALADDPILLVTATRTERPESDIGQAVTVIDQQGLVTRQSDTIADVLRTVPGATVARTGGIGTSASVFIRGAESDQTVTLIDGVKLNDPAAPGGGFNFGNLLVGNIARVEVLRGSQSVLWGSQAIGGVVNLTTAEPSDHFTAASRVEYGSHATRQIAVSAAQKFGAVKAAVGITDFSTDGISSFNERRGATERDGYRNFGAHAKFEIALSDEISLDLRGWYSRARVEVDGFPPPDYSLGDTSEYSRTRETVGYAGLNLALLDGRFHNRIALTQTEIMRGDFDPTGFATQTFDSTGRNSRLEYQGGFDFNARLQSVFGIEREISQYVSSSFGAPATRGESRITGTYAELIGKPFDGFTAIVGLRRDEHAEFGGNTSVSGSIAWSPNAGATTLRGSYGEGFKAPSLYQLQSEYGNSLLRPEAAQGWDSGITQRLLGDRIEIGATYFHRDTVDLINFISCATPFGGICVGRPFGTYDNVARATSRGIETTLLLRPLTGLSVQANYSNIDSRNRSPGSASAGNALARRPRETSSALVDYRWASGLETGVTYTNVGHSFDDARSTRAVAGYELVDLRLAFPFGARAVIQARVENLFDEQYETVYGYGTLGRTVYAALRLNF
jgi:vitamin B12 transporter